MIFIFTNYTQARLSVTHRHHWWWWGRGGVRTVADSGDPGSHGRHIAAHVIIDQQPEMHNTDSSTKSYITLTTYTSKD